MKKLFSLVVLFSILSLGLTGTASAKCYAWKKVCKSVYETKTWWATCYDKNNYPYQCKKTKRVYVGKKCHNKCISWKPKYNKHQNAY